jgi:putative DNA primase/helicase
MNEKSPAQRIDEYLAGRRDERASSESFKSFSTISTISTGAGSSGIESALDSASDRKSADTASLKDSLLAQFLADSLKNILALDEVSGDWYECGEGIWHQITKVRATKIINTVLHRVLPNGFSMSKLSAIEGFLRLYLSLDRWESDKSLLPLKNGILNTKAMLLMPYSVNHKFNWQLPYIYDPDAKITVIKRWLWDVTGQDIEIVNIIRAFFRIALIGGDVQKFLEVVGPGGTGKSTLTRLLIMLVGEANHAATDLKNLEQNRFEVATLYSKRLALISDSSRYGGEVSVLKAITGGDPVRHERKNQQQSGSFVFSGVVVIASNEAIQSTDYSSGLARRRMPISFVRKVTDEDKAKWRHLGGIEKAMQAELPGLLNWVLSMTDDELNGCLSSINGALTKSSRNHLVETNKLAAWIDDNLVIKESSILYIGGSTRSIKDDSEVERECSAKLYPNYLRWCDKNGVQPIAVQRFSNNLLDIAEHCKLPVKQVNRDSQGRKIAGFKIRTIADIAVSTPITKVSLSAGGCRSSADTNTPRTLDSADDADSADITLFNDKERF